MTDSQKEQMMETLMRAVMIIWPFVVAFPIAYAWHFTHTDDWWMVPLSLTSFAVGIAGMVSLLIGIE